MPKNKREKTKILSSVRQVPYKLCTVAIDIDDDSAAVCSRALFFELYINPWNSYLIHEMRQCLWLCLSRYICILCSCFCDAHTKERKKRTPIAHFSVTISFTAVNRLYIVYPAERHIPQIQYKKKCEVYLVGMISVLHNIQLRIHSNWMRHTLTNTFRTCALLRYFLAMCF